jgi:hypothetical protein
MTWLIVVGAIVAVALAVHFGEERRSRAKSRARAARPAKARKVTYACSVDEAWEVDLEAMVAVVTRGEARGASTTTRFRLFRNADGGLELEPSTTPRWSLPKAVAERIEKAQAQAGSRSND